MDIVKSFAYVFDDDRWVTKLLIAAGILLLGVLLGILIIPAILAAALLGGYGVEITRRVIRGQTPILPEWDNAGDLLVDGIKVWVIGLVYAIPAILVGLCLGTPAAIIAEDAPEFSQLVSAFSSCIDLLWGVVVAFLLPAAIGRFVAKDDLGAAFQFGEVFNLVRDNFTTYLLVAIMSWVAGLIGGLGILICGLGWLVTAPYSSFVMSHLAGQGYLEATGQMVEPFLEEEIA
jgi:hypothetical protein